MSRFGFLWSLVFSRMPYPIRVVMNLIALPFVAGRAIFWIFRDHAKESPVNMMSFEELTTQLKLVEHDSDESLDQMRALTAAIQALIDEGDFATLDETLIKLDQSRAATPAGHRLWRTALEAVWSDVMDGRATETDDCGEYPVEPIPYEAIEPFISAAQANPDSYALGGLAGFICLKVGWGQRGGDYAPFVTEGAFENMSQLFDIADGFLTRFDATTLSSPMLADIAYQREAGLDGTLATLEKIFETQIGLDPGDHTAMAQHAFHLLPRWYGDYQILGDAAQKVYAQHHADQGAATYAAFFLDLLADDDGALASLDLDLFGDGIIDMIAHSPAPQATVNSILGRLCPIWIGHLAQSQDLHEPKERIKALYQDIVRSQLTDVIGPYWKLSRKERFYLIGLAFEEELAAGETVVLAEKRAA